MPFDEGAVTCAWVLARVDDYVDDADGGLAASERAAYARHVAACASCRAQTGAAAAIVRELRAFPVHEAPAAVIAAAERVLAGECRSAPPGERRRAARLSLRSVARWVPAVAAAAAVAALAAGTRWNAPVPSTPNPVEQARVERAARETTLAFSYVNRYARRSGRIVTDDILEKRVLGSVGRAVEHGLSGDAPKLPHAAESSGIVETPAPHERS